VNLAAFGQEFHKSMPAIYLLCFRCLQYWAKVETKLCEPCAVGFGFHIKTRLNSIRVNYLTILVLPPLHSNPRQLCSPRSLYFTFYSSISDSTCGFYGYCFWTLGLMEQNLNSFLFTCTFHLMKFFFPRFPFELPAFVYGQLLGAVKTNMQA